MSDDNYPPGHGVGLFLFWRGVVLDLSFGDNLRAEEQRLLMRLALFDGVERVGATLLPASFIGGLFLSEPWRLLWALAGVVVGAAFLFGIGYNRRLEERSLNMFYTINENYFGNDKGARP